MSHRSGRAFSGVLGRHRQGPTDVASRGTPLAHGGFSGSLRSPGFGKLKLVSIRAECWLDYTASYLLGGEASH